MSTVRLRRLTADFTQLDEYAKAHPRLRLIQTEGEPPEKYQLEYRIRSLRQVGEELQEVKSHIVEITLPRSYPRVPPQCRMLSPVFHPNIAPHAICVGDHWSAGESLKSIVMRIGEMLAYQSYNVKSPLNGEAARWVDEHQDELPLDRVSMIVEESRPVSREDDDDADGVKPAPVALRQAAPRPAPIPTPAPRAIDESIEVVTPGRVRREPEPEAVTPRPQRSVAPIQAAPIQAAPVQVAPAAAPATITVACPQCATKYKIPVQHSARSAVCRVCETRFELSSARVE